VGVPLRYLPQEERPREKLIREGSHSLSDAELLAILLRTGVKGLSVLELAQTILHHCRERDRDNPLGLLLELKPNEIRRMAPGLGDAKLCQIQAALQLGRRSLGKPLRRIEVSNPRAVYEFLLSRVAQDQEQFMVIYVTAKNQVIDVETITRGTLTWSPVHPREVFKSAITRCAHAIILAHNHPSGDPTPSREDREVTRRFIEVGKIVGIEILDHLVIGKGRYVSFREKGLAEWS
jgi:DNA repair protein RadC